MSWSAGTIVELFRRVVRERDGERALGRRGDPGGWRWLTYGELARQTEACAAGLRARGVVAGERVALVCDNRVEWPVIAYAVFGLGAVLVPVDPALAQGEQEAIVADARAALVIVESAGQLEAFETLLGVLPGLRQVIGIDLPDGDVRGFGTLCARGTEALDPAVSLPSPGPEALAELVYTTGEDGRLVCARLSHGRLLAHVRELQELLPVDPAHAAAKSVASVPWAMPLARLADLYHGLLAGVAIATGSSEAGILGDLAEIRPTRLVAGASLLRRIFHLVVQDQWLEPPLAQRMFFDGLAAAAQKVSGQPVGRMEHLELFLDEEQVFARVREQLGGRLAEVLCSGALCHEVAGVLHAMHVRVVGTEEFALQGDDGRPLIVRAPSGELVLAGGERILPAPAEEAIKLSPYVRDVMIHGDAHRHAVALVVPDEEAIAALARPLGVHLGDPTSDPAVLLLLAEQIRSRLQGFPRHVLPRRIAVIGEAFSVANGLLWPSLELRRERIAARFEAELHQLYSTPPPPPRPRRRTGPPALDALRR
jgi:long-subunit acyl-CoA synthetase (AMP-forming)